MNAVITEIVAPVSEVDRHFLGPSESENQWHELSIVAKDETYVKLVPREKYIVHGTLCQEIDFVSCANIRSEESLMLVFSRFLRNSTFQSQLLYLSSLTGLTF